MHHLMIVVEAPVFEGRIISIAVDLVERLEAAIAQLEAAAVQHEAEVARLRRIEAAAAAALAELDEMVGEGEMPFERRSQAGIAR